MKIECAFSSDVHRVVFAYDADSDTRTMTPTLLVAVNESRAIEMFGSRLAGLAFSSRDEEGVYGYKAITPTLKCEKHVVTFGDGDALPTVPIIDKIEPLN